MSDETTMRPDRENVLAAIDGGAQTFREIEDAARIEGGPLREILHTLADEKLVTNGEDHEPGWFLTLGGANYVAGAVR